MHEISTDNKGEVSVRGLKFVTVENEEEVIHVCVYIFYVCVCVSARGLKFVTVENELEVLYVWVYVFVYLYSYIPIYIYIYIY